MSFKAEKITVGDNDKIAVLEIISTGNTLKIDIFKELLVSFVVVPSIDVISKEDYVKIEIYIGSPPKEILCLLTGLKWLQLTSSGVDGYDNPTLYENYDKVIITNAAGVYGVPISEYVIGVMCLMSKYAISNNLKKRKLGMDRNFHIEIRQANILILGLGDIGLHVAELCKGFSCKKVIGVNRLGVCSNSNVDETYKIDDLISIVPQADYIISALPDTENTGGIFHKAVFEAMKCTAILINVGRGNAVVQSDLVYAMKQKLISGAVLDVTSPDPLPFWHPLRRCQRVFLTEHRSAYSQFNMNRANELYISQIHKYLNGQPLVNIKLSCKIKCPSK